MRLLERLQSESSQRPDVRAYVDVWTGKSMSWRSLRDRIAALAGLLHASLAPNSVVIIRCENGLDFPVAFLATLAAGCAAFPISVESPPKEVRGVAEQANAGAVLTTDSTHFDGWTPPILLNPGEIAGSDVPFPTVHPAGKKTRLLLRSSGSTGKPKIVCRSGGSVDAVCDQMCQSIGIGSDDRVLATVPLCHSYGIEHGLLAPVWAGATVHLCRGLDLPLIKRELTQSKITLLPGVPSMYEMLANHAGDGERYPDLRVAYSAGAPLPNSVAEAAFRRCGIRVGQLYGASEIGSVSFSDPRKPHFEPSSVGQPMPGVTVRITAGGDWGVQITTGEPGHVWISAASMFTAYFGETQTPIVDGFYPTGDLGWIDGDGNLFINGRVTLLIDIGGLKVNPLEVEAVLMQHEEVGDCIVIPVRQSETVLRLKAVITPRDPARWPRIEQIRQFARERLATYKVPRVFDVRATLPRTATGKILRHLVEA